MKNFYSILAVFFLTAAVWAQSPQKMSYQAVIRNSSNVLVVSKPVGMKISILQGSETGTAVYIETQTPTSNANGLVSIEIGGGTIITGTIAGIDWSTDTYFIKIESDPTGGTDYTITGISQLLSVPYALFANSVGTFAENDPVFEASPTKNITSTNITNWNSAFGWGNHASAGYQPLIAAGTSTQYLSGDKTWQVLDKTAVGLGNIDNTSDLNKPVSTATQAALDFKANLASPTLTGTPLAPTAIASTNTTQIATTQFVTTAVTTATTPDATTLVKGKVLLAGDLSGTADLPIIADGKITTIKILDANVTDSKIATVSGSKVIGNIPGSAANVTGTVAIANGGTGAVTAAGAKINLALDNVNNTTDANKPVSTATQAALNLKAPIASPTFTGTVSGITSAMVGLGNVNNTTDLLKPVSTATQAALDFKANLASPTLTGTPLAPTAIASTNTTQIATTQFVTTAVTTAVATATTPDATTLVKGKVLLAGDLSGTADLPIIADGKITTSKILDANVTDSKIATVSGSKVIGNIPGSAANVTGTVAIANGGTGAVTAAGAKINLALDNVNNTTDANKPVSTATQAALNLKAPIASPTFTGTVSGITSAMVGLGNVNNTTDLLKPVSTATQAALDFKANLASPTLTGTPLAPTAIASTNTTQIATTQFVTTAVTTAVATATTPDATTLVKGKVLLAGDLSGTADLPIIADGKITTSKILDANVTDSKIATVSGSKVIGNIPGSAANVTGTVAIANGGTGAVTAAGAKTNLALDNVNNTTDANKPVSTATQAALNLKAPIASPTFTGTVSGITSAMVGLGSVDNTTDLLKPVSTATQAALDFKANLASPTLTGTPLAPTAIASTNTTQIATTQFVTTAVTTAVATATTPDATTLVKGKVLLAGDLSGTADLPIIADGKITTSKILDANVTDSKIATVSGSKVIGNIPGSAANVTGTVAIANGGTGAVTAAGAKINLALDNVNNTTDANKPVSTATQAALDFKANLASPTLTGTPLAPTAIASTNTTQIATTQFVTTAVTTATTPDATTLVKGKVLLAGDLSGTADLPIIADGKITTIKILDANVTDSKIATVSGSKVIGNIPGSAANVTGTVAIANGGTGAVTAAGAKTNLALDNVNNTTDANKPVSTATQAALNLKAPIASPTFTGTVSGITSAMVGLGSVDNTTDLLKPVSTATQAALDFKANLASPTLTGTPLAPTAIASTNTTQIATTQFVTTAVTTAVATATTPDATTLVKGKVLLAGDLSGTADLPIIADGKITTSKILDANVTDSKIATVSGSKVIGNIPGSAANVTGTVAIANGGTGAVTAAGAKINLALDNVNNTTDANKPVSTATQAALDFKANLASPTLTGTPLAPTAIASTNTTQIATTQFVTTAVTTAVATATTPDATTLVKGKVLLAGDLSGTADLPIIADGKITTSKILDANVTDSKIATVSGSKVIGNIPGSAANVTGTVAIANGGTGAVTAAGAKINLALDNVNNTTDANKPVSTATQAALDFKANLASPTLTGTPLAPTAIASTNTTQIATTQFVTTAVTTAVATATTPDATTLVKGKVLLAGDLSGTADLPTVAAGVIDNSKVSATAEIVDTKLATISTVGKVSNSATTATSVNTASTIVARDATNNFSAGMITANLTGNVTGNTSGTAANVTDIVLGVNGGTGIANSDKTITLGGNLSTAADFTTSGVFATTLTSTAATNVTLPTVGTLATLAGIETLTNKTLTSPSITTPTGIVKGDVGLSDVDNTTDLLKPVSTATQTALNLKANIDSPTLTGTPSAPTAAAGNSSTQIATTAFVTSTTFTHYIGELYGGGIVVAVWKQGGIEKGLIASLTDLNSGTPVTWSNFTPTLIGTNAQSPTIGQTNTTAIISQGASSGAAVLCDNYTGGAVSGWYLPAAWELNQCYNASYIVNTILGSNGFKFNVYWSSTEQAATTAFTQDFSLGRTYAVTKTDAYYVRAVRKF